MEINMAYDPTKDVVIFEQHSECGKHCITVNKYNGGHPKFGIMENFTYNGQNGEEESKKYPKKRFTLSEIKDIHVMLGQAISNIENGVTESPAQAKPQNTQQQPPQQQPPVQQKASIDPLDGIVG